MDDRREVLSIVDALAHEYPNIIVISESDLLGDPDLIRASMLRAEPEDAIRSVTLASGERLVVLSDRPWTHSNVTAFAREYDKPVAGIIPASRTGDHGAAITKLARVMTGQQIGVAFGAGAAKGFAHIGALRRFEEIGLPIDVVTGSSIGAAIAAGCAVGLSVQELSETVARIASKAIRPTVPVQSFLSNRAVREELKSLGVRMRFEDLQLPLGIVTTDIYRRCEVTFSRGLIWPGLLASMALPGIYPPLPVRGGYLVDGGVLNPVPARQARHLGAGVVIGVRLVGTKSNEGAAPRGRPLAPEIIMRSMELMYSRLSEISHNQADVTIEVSLEGGGIGDFKRKDAYIQAGYDAAVVANESILEAIPLVAPAP
jgi:NTE family protein